MDSACKAVGNAWDGREEVWQGVSHRSVNRGRWVHSVGSPGSLTCNLIPFFPHYVVQRSPTRSRTQGSEIVVDAQGRGSTKRLAARSLLTPYS